MKRPLWGYIPRRLRWPDTIPSMRREVLGDSWLRSYLIAPVRMWQRWQNWEQGDA